MQATVFLGLMSEEFSCVMKRWDKAMVKAALLVALALAACGGGSPGPTVTAQPDAGPLPPQPDAGSPPPTPGSHTLTVSKNGSGTVRSSPAGIDCGRTCATT